MSEIKITAGEEFGWLTVLAEGPRHITSSGITRRTAVCKCECGTEKVIVIHDLRKGSTRSCGCKKQMLHAAAVSTHGMKGTPTYRSWRSMLDRCNSLHPDKLRNYGGRGIKVCDRWKCFENFLSDMGIRPSKDHSVDRIDNQGNYEPGNCRWATHKIQSNNKRTNVFVTYEGETKTVTQWAEHLGMSPAALERRLWRYGWPVSRALTEPLAKWAKRRYL
jgi:hypothetical protein